MALLKNGFTGLFVDTDALSHVYTFNGPDGAIDSDTVTDGHWTWKKTYNYTGTQLSSETEWVKQ